MPVETGRLRAALKRLGGERGFTIVPAMGMLTMATLLLLGTYTAVGGDMPLARGDQDRKQAYAAAEAGIAYYLYHLDEDNSYWLKCTNVPPPSASEPSPVNQAWSGAGTDPRVWRRITGSSAEYTIELLPAPGYSECGENDQRSMLDPRNGSLRIRSTGRVGNVKRSLVATLRRKSFLDYLYFTDYETLDPAAYSNTDTQRYASANCVRYHTENRRSPCTDIRFVTGDEVEGPLHTNDSILMCGSPTFGRTAGDSIEASGPAPGWWATGGCPGSPNFVGTWKPASSPLAMPSSNNSLANLAHPAYRFTGTTAIRMSGSNMSVWNNNQNPKTQTIPFPSNGVVYVRNGSCGTTYRRVQTYNDPLGCANVYISGTYSQDLTLASENDIIVWPAPNTSDGDIIRSGDAMLGLIPNNFVRVYHPVTFSNNNTSCTNAAGTMQNVRIDAAILALTHSFIVDNYYCGAKLGTLTVNGAIAQKFRGPVGTGGASSGTGYLKNYRYDDRMQFRNPIHFLDPVQAAWTTRRQTEQVPAR